MNEIIVPLLVFGAMVAVLWFGVLGIRGVKKDKRTAEPSALAMRDDGRDANMLTPGAVVDDHAASRPIGGDAPLAGIAARRPGPARTREDTRPRPDPLGGPDDAYAASEPATLVET